MNSKDLRKYWVNKYSDVTGRAYDNSTLVLDLTLLKRLIKKYNEYVVLEAIDRFLENEKVKYKTIKYFSNGAFFEDRFYDIINEKDIIKYKRLYRTHPRVKELIEEYLNYTNTISLSDQEKLRKLEILEILKGLEKELDEPTRA